MKLIIIAVLMHNKCTKIELRRIKRVDKEENMTNDDI